MSSKAEEQRKPTGKMTHALQVSSKHLSGCIMAYALGMIVSIFLSRYFIDSEDTNSTTTVKFALAMLTQIGVISIFAEAVRDLCST